MYPVSGAFLRAVAAKTRKYYWSGRITTKAGVVYEFGPEEILAGSGSISAQCTDGTEISLGSVYAAELGITLLTDIDRYTLLDAQVEMTYHLRVSEKSDSEEILRILGLDVVPDGDLDLLVEQNGDFAWSVESDGVYEAVPMGVFEIAEANRKGRCLEIRAYDFMLRFDRKFSEMGTFGAAYDFLSFICRMCRVELGMSREKIEALPNGTVVMSIYEENDIETCRDVLFYVAQILGCFAVIGRDGKLYFRRFGMEPVLTVTDRHRFSSSFSDFVTRFTAVSSTNVRTQIAEYYAMDPDDALTMNLGVNPLIQFSLAEMRERVVRDILTAVSVIAYVPFESETIGNPALDLGDVLVFSGGLADATKVAALTQVEYRIGGKQRLRCVGKNPRLATAKSKNDKNIVGLVSQMEQTAALGRMQVLSFTNVMGFTIGGSFTRIAGFEFILTELNHVMLLGQVDVDVSPEVVERSAVAAGTIVLPDPEEDPGAMGQSVVENGENNDLMEENGDLGMFVVRNGGSCDVVVENGGNDGDGGSGDDSSGGTEIQVSLPVSWSEPGRAVLEVMYELDGEEIVVFRPMDSAGPGIHLLPLFYVFSGLDSGRLHVLRVYLRILDGAGVVGPGDVVVSLMAQALLEAEPWDGVLELSDVMGRAGLGSGLDADVRLTASFEDMVGAWMYEPAYLGVQDVIERAAFGGFCAPVELD